MPSRTADVWKYVRVAVFAAVLAAFAAVCANVFLYGDDLFYSVFTQHGFSYYVKRHVEHYQLANGRVIVHLLATALLGLDIWVWRVLNSLALSACVLLAASPRRGADAVGEREASVAKLAFAGAVMLMTSTQVTRQSIYWLTGSLNYVYPCLMLLIYWRVLERSFEGEDRAFWSLCPLAFLAAATNEQGGLMSFGLTLMFILWARFIAKKRVRAAHLVSLGLAFVGFLTVVLSPGLTHRADVAGTEQGGLALIIGNMPRTMRDLMYGYSNRANVAALAAAALYCAARLLRCARTDGKGWNVRSVIFGGIPLAAAVCTAVCIAFAPDTAATLEADGITWRFALYAAATCFGYAVAFIGAGVAVMLDTGSPRALMAAVLGVGSQIAMSASPVSGPRTVWCYIVMAAVFGCECLGFERDEKSPTLRRGSVNDNAVRVLRAAIVAVAVVVAAVNWRAVFSGYRQNAPVYSENLAVIQSYKENGENVEQGADGGLVQRQLPVETAAWVMPYQNSYYDPYYNLCYHLPQQTEVTWVR